MSSTWDRSASSCLFHTDEEGRPTTNTHENASYFDVGPIDLAENVRRDIVLNLEGMDIEWGHPTTNYLRPSMKSIWSTRRDWLRQTTL